jgi:hypothetical protein
MPESNCGWDEPEVEYHYVPSGLREQREIDVFERFQHMDLRCG